MTSQSPADETPSEAYANAWASIQHLVMNEGASWSGREKNCLYLNQGDVRFANVSAASGVDFQDDARAVASIDWDDDGRLDLIVKNRTGPRIRLLRNLDRSGNGFVAIELQGTTCNRDAIGSRVTVDLGGRTVMKTLYAGDGYLSQSSKRLHFGLGDAREVRSVTVRWPGGERQVFEGLRPGGRYRLVQGTPAPEELPARTIPQVASAPMERVEPLTKTNDRVVLTERLPLAPIPLPSYAGSRTVGDLAGGPVLINLWATWCSGCMKELGEFKKRRFELDRAGLTVVPLSTDAEEHAAKARETIDRFGFGESAGAANPQFMQLLEVFLVEVLGSSERIPMPTSLLLDPAGQLVAIYLGPVEVDRLLEDVALVGRMRSDGKATGLLTGGRWFNRPERQFSTMSRVLQSLGRPKLAEFYLELWKERRGKR